MVAKIVGIAGNSPTAATGTPNSAGNTDHVDLYVAGVDAGDLCLAFIGSGAQGTVNGPAGWTKIADGWNSTYGGELTVWAKILTANDLGTIITFSGNGGEGWIGGSVAVKRYNKKRPWLYAAAAANAAGNGLQPTQSSVTNNPDTVSSRYDLVFSACVAESTNGQGLVSIPAGYTRLLFSQSSAVATSGVSLVVCAASIRPFTNGAGQPGETFTFDRNCAMTVIAVSIPSDMSGVGGLRR